MVRGDKINTKKFITVDGNTATSNIAYALSEVAAIYPITPSSLMGELADLWASQGKKNIFGQTVEVQEMQSEGGASGAIHGSLSAGALTTTFTASQGLLLMLPNMFKIAGELLPAVFHVSSRSLAYQSLSIFGDHSDVMAARGTGFAFLASGNVQEAQDMAAISHLAAIESRIPFLHFFDGFRTSNEIQKIESLDYDILKSMVDMDSIHKFRRIALNPEHPVAKVGAQNPDVYFQGREVSNKYYLELPNIVKKYLKLFGEKTGRKYKLFDYIGKKGAESIIISMGSSTDTIEETVNYLNKQGYNVGAVKVRLYRPFSVKDFVDIIPSTVKKIAVLDRTKESGSIGEPLYLDIVAALKDTKIKIVGGRYGLSSKEFTPSMVKAVFDHLETKCSHNFTVGINDDLTKTSLDIKDDIDTEYKGVNRCKFWGYGSDGTVSANKSSIKIIGSKTDKYVQAYFSYDSKKAGGVTVSHLRFSDKKIQSPYLLNKSDFIALHKPSYIGRYDILEGLTNNGTFLLNTDKSKDEVFDSLTKDMQEIIIKKKINFYIIDASKIARISGLGNRINTVMQAAFFKIADIIPVNDAINYIKDSIKKQFSKKGQEIVDMNWNCVDKSLDAIEKVDIPKEIKKSEAVQKLISGHCSDFVKHVIEPTMRIQGDNIPVSKMPLDGAVPLSTTKLEKRGVTEFVPEWISDKCIQCGKCAFVCPHAAIRIKQINKKELDNAPENFKVIKSNTKNDKEFQFRVQVYPEDCLGCTLCVNACPVQGKALKMRSIESSRESGENENQKFFEILEEDILEGVPAGTVKETQLKQPLLEFSGACSGCGETPYVKLVTQLFGDRMIIANATGCSSIWGGTFPTIPYCKNKDGKGPAWANSLFEDNAEYGYGMKLAVDANRVHLKDNINKILEIGTTKDFSSLLKKMIDKWDEAGDEINQLSTNIIKLIPTVLSKSKGSTKEILDKINDLKYYLIKKSVWIIGGDGWAYDIGYGGLDHVLAQGKNVNVLVLDTEVYSNTGGQSSKATPIAASAKFAVSGKKSAKKNLGLMMMTYGNIYVASVAMGANNIQTIKALKEAEEYGGPSIVIAYAPCIAHGIDMHKTQEEQKKAVDAGYWPLYRYNPDLVKKGKNPLIWESGEAKLSFKEFLLGENRYRTLQLQFPEESERLYKLAEEDAKRRFNNIKGLLNDEY